MSKRIPAPRDRISARAPLRERSDGFVRQTFVLPRPDARSEARAYLDRYPKAAYMTCVETWRELDDGRIEFTMMRLPTAD